jgi:hypothetical protein
LKEAMRQHHAAATAWIATLRSRLSVESGIFWSGSLRRMRRAGCLPGTARGQIDRLAIGLSPAVIMVVWPLPCNAC